MLERFRSSLNKVFLIYLRPYDRVGTYHRALSALYTRFRVPYGYIHGYVAFLELGGPGGPCPVHGHLRYFHALAFPAHDLGRGILHESRGILRNRLDLLCLF